MRPQLRAIRWLVAVAVILVVPLAGAQPSTSPSSAQAVADDSAADPGPAGSSAGTHGGLPPGHPDIGSAAPDNTDQAPSGNPDLGTGQGDDDELPPGHPDIGDQAATRNAVTAAADLPKGTVEIQVLDAKSAPVPQATVDLVVSRESVAEGNSSSDQTARTDLAGKVRFSGLASDSQTSYRVDASSSGARSGSASFVLGRDLGSRITLRVYPLVQDIHKAMVAMQSSVFVEMRDDVLAFEVACQVHNLGQTTWVPQGIDMRLPEGWKGFSTQPISPDLTVEQSGDGVSLRGALAPGRSSVQFNFQVPNPNRRELDLDLGLFPNVAEVRVGAAIPKGAELEVQGYPRPQATLAPNGQRVLVTGRAFTQQGGLPPSDLELSMTGLPVQGDGRWVAVLLGLAIGLGGLVWTVGPGRAKAGKGAFEQNVEHARQRLLAELAAVERARKNETIGPATYEQARHALMSALVRLEAEGQN